MNRVELQEEEEKKQKESLELASKVEANRKEADEKTRKKAEKREQSMRAAMNKALDFARYGEEEELKSVGAFRAALRKAKTKGNRRR